MQSELVRHNVCCTPRYKMLGFDDWYGKYQSDILDLYLHICQISKSNDIHIKVNGDSFYDFVQLVWETSTTE